jgi:hypothetical protein
VNGPVSTSAGRGPDVPAGTLSTPASRISPAGISTSVSSTGWVGAGWMPISMRTRTLSSDRDQESLDASAPGGQYRFSGRTVDFRTYGDYRSYGG